MAGTSLVAAETRSPGKVDLPAAYYEGDLSSFAAAGLRDLRPALDVAALPTGPAFIVPANAAPEDDGWKRFFRKQDASELGPYSAGSFWSQSASVPWDIAGIYGFTTAVGVLHWDWGSEGFHFHNEGWFGKKTGSLGTDKLGHAFTTYLYTEYLTQRIMQEADDPRGAAITAALLAMGVQTYVEVFDGFSVDHGFSYEDLTMDGIGALTSVLRSAYPEFGRKVDFRMEYLPSGNAKFSPLSDYSGQKYVMALKLAGFDSFADTPLRFLELQAGYYARGFTAQEKARGEKRRREPYVGIGLNLQPLFAESDTAPALAAQRVLEYVQVPYTYIPTKRD